MNLQDVPYRNLFEEFLRRVVEHPEKSRLREGVVVMRVAEEFDQELKRRLQVNAQGVPRRHPL